MKKKIILAISLTSSIFSFAQIKTNVGTYNKPTAGQKIMEVTFAPNLAGSGMFSLPTLNSNMEMLGIKARKFTKDNRAIRAIGNLSVKNSGEEGAKTAFLVGAGFGFEHHMTGAERLSTYWGYEANVGYHKDELETGKFGFGANAFTGFDFYIMPKIYLGVEVAYGASFTNTSPKGGTSVTQFEVAPGITPFFRLGWNL